MDIIKHMVVLVGYNPRFRPVNYRH